MKTERQKTKKPKQKSAGKLKTEAWDAFSLYVRTRDCLQTTNCSSFGLCVTCGKRYHIKLLQAGHFIPGRHNSNLFSEEGTHAQCYNCNVNLKGNTLEYRRQIIRLYGLGFDEELERRNRETKQYKKHELVALKKHYQQETKKLLES